jgi:hypothetical protein
MKSRLIAVAIHKRVIYGNDRFAPKAVVLIGATTLIVM